MSDHQLNDSTGRQGQLALRVAVKQTEILYGTSKRGLLSTLLYSSIIFIAVFEVVDRQWATAWYASILLAIFLRFLLTRAFYQASDISDTYALWQKRFVVAAAITGAIWGAGSVIMFPIDQPGYQLFVGFIIIGMVSTAVAYLAVVPVAYFSYMFLAISPFAVSMFFYGYPFTLMGLVSVPYMAFLYATGKSVSRDLEESLRRGFENELLAEELALQKKRAVKASKAKSEFLSSMSHELRTPLNAVMGFAQLLRFSATRDEDKRNIDHILTGANHLLDLINDVLDLSRVESGEMDVNIHACPIREIVDACVTIIRPSLQKLSLGIDTDVDDVEVLVDERRFRQALLNLVSNAVKYNRQFGHVHISAKMQDSGVCRVSVGDSGRGIAESDLKTIFDPFVRIKHDDETIDGTGIGLSICKRLVEEMGGEIGGESQLGHGSTFWIDIPALSQAR